MFCKNCGKEIPDSSELCIHCGTAVGSQAAPFENKESSKKTNNQSKLLLLIGAGVVCIAAVIILVVLLFGGGATGAVEDYYDALLYGDGEIVEELIPEDVFRDFKDEYGVKINDIVDYVEDSYKDSMEEMENEYGKGASLDVEILDEDEVYEEELDEIKDFLKDNYDISKSSVDDARVVCVKITLDADEDFDVQYTKHYVVKIDGEWYVVDNDGNFLASSIIISAYYSANKDNEDFDFDF